MKYKVKSKVEGFNVEGNEELEWYSMINLDVIDYLIVNIKVERKKKNENGIIMDNNKKFD